jgi:tRNA (cmo5U34)-methyltransferase
MMSLSTSAYDLPGRVASYDRDMQIMHPNREHMVRVALDLLPDRPDRQLRALDLGVGTGHFTAELLLRHPEAEVVAVDGAATMMELAEARLGDLASRVDFRITDFRDLDAHLLRGEEFDVAISSFALHHLPMGEKEEVVRSCVRRLRPGGWFLNADLIVSESPLVEARIQVLRVAGIVDRAPIRDERFRTPSLTRQYLNDLEQKEGDQPLTLAQDIDCLRQAGLESVSAIWVEFREAVTVGTKPV